MSPNMNIQQTMTNHGKHEHSNKYFWESCTRNPAHVPYSSRIINYNLSIIEYNSGADPKHHVFWILAAMLTSGW